MGNPAFPAQPGHVLVLSFDDDILFEGRGDVFALSGVQYADTVRPYIPIFDLGLEYGCKASDFNLFKHGFG